jgi:tetratricopeptide (TPR) repeat protein
MNSCCLILLALLLPMQRWNATVTGHILDHEGKPLAGATVTYTNVGIFDRVDQRIKEGTGQVYKIKTDKQGRFELLGMQFGIYQIEVTAPDGARVYSGRKNINDPNDKEFQAQNDLEIDLSKVESSQVEPGAETNLAGGKKTKEQMELIREENANKAKINRLIVQLQGALDAKEWPSATDLLQQLIAIDPNRWEFYQNLGTIQANQTHYQEAVASFAKGVEVAEKLLPNAADPQQMKTYIGDLYLSEGDAYNRMGKLDEAVAMYAKAADISFKPGAAHFHACNALFNNGRNEQAIEECKQAVAADPGQWEFYQVLGGAQNALGKSEDALESYEKGAEAAKKMMEENPDSGRAKTGLGQILNAEGNLLVHIKKHEQAIEAFSKAAEVAAYPAMPYFNICATYYNLRRSQEALAACDRAIAADPTLSDAYFIKASILFGEGRNEAGRYVVPAGTTDSLNKYLQYAPFGEHASTVRSMIDRVNGGAPYKPAKP